MASHQTKRFYESELPQDLTPSQKWLAQYHENSQRCINYLVEKGASRTAYQTANRCLFLLREYLLANDLIYSHKNALKWLGLSPPVKGYLSTLLRIKDFYDYGCIQPINTFPKSYSYSTLLSESWKNILSGFLSKHQTVHKSLLRIKNQASRFLYGLQSMGISSPSEITFEVLEIYCINDSELHRSNASRANYIYAVGDVLRYMSDNKLCTEGLSWYPFYWMHDRILHISELSVQEKNIIESVKTVSLKFPMEKFAGSIPEFLAEMKQYGYEKTGMNRAKFTLYNLLLFLAMNNLGYHPVIADIWLEHQKVYYSSQSSWKALRRMLYLYSTFITEGYVNPFLNQRIKPRIYDTLPDWCHKVADAFFIQKKKEGWKESTINMLYSSVTRFCRFLCDQGITSFSDITPQMIKSFNLQDIHRTPEGKNAYNIRIRQFLRFLEREGWIPYGSYLALSCVCARHERIVAVLTPEELEVIGEKRNNADTPTKLRNIAILLLGLHMGLRASDIIGLKLIDIDWKEQSLRIVQQKTDHEILLPMPVDVANAVYLYIKKGRPKSDNPYFFLKLKSPYNSLTRSACSKALNDTLPERSVPGSGFHVTRKTFATEQLNHSVCRQSVADLLGHRGTTSLVTYLNLDTTRMRLCPLSLSDVGLTMEEGYYER